MHCTKCAGLIVIQQSYYSDPSVLRLHMEPCKCGLILLVVLKTKAQQYTQIITPLYQILWSYKSRWA